MFEVKLAAGAFVCALLAQASAPDTKEYGVIGACVLSSMSAVGLLLKWLTSHVTKQEERFTAERKEDRESMKAMAGEWKDCHRETCDQMNSTLKDLTTAIRENRKP